MEKLESRLQQRESELAFETATVAKLEERVTASESQVNEQRIVIEGLQIELQKVLPWALFVTN
jgi:uncharacterized coiled-coil protein SlyX